MSASNLARNSSSSSSPELVVHSVAVRKPGADGTNTDEGDTSTTCVRSPESLLSVPFPRASPGRRSPTARDTSRNLSADTPGLNLTR